MVSTWRGGSLTYTVCGYIYSLVSTLDFNLLTPDLSFYVLTKKELHTRKMYNATEQLLHILFAMNAPSCFPPLFPLTLFGVPDTKKSLLNKQWFSTMANRKEKRGGGTKTEPQNKRNPCRGVPEKRCRGHNSMDHVRNKDDDIFPRKNWLLKNDNMKREKIRGETFSFAS